MKRLVTAAVVLPALVLYLARLSTAWFLLLLLVVAAAGLIEFTRMVNLPGTLRQATVISGLLVLVNAYRPLVAQTDLLAGLFVLLLLVRLLAIRRPEASLRDVGLALLGILYIALLLSCQVALRERSVGWIFLLYGSVWASDSLALYIGSWLGRHKLYPVMSPNKTVEGFLAGLAGGALGALLVNLVYAFTSPGIAAGAGLLLSAAGQAGDLVESMFKRDAGVKDSSDLFPGHGGILDKIDASLLAGPVLYFLVIYFERPS